MPRPAIVLSVAASFLVVGGIIVLLWMIGSASGERARFSSLEIAPKDTEAFFAINTDPTSPQWLAVNDSLGVLNAKDPLRKAIDDVLAEVNLDWEDDILPMAGDEGFLSIPKLEDVTTSGGFVAGFRIADQDKAREVFADLRRRADEDGEPFEEEEYQGVTIYFTTGEGIVNQDAFPGDGNAGNTGAAVALSADVLAFGGSMDDVKSVIDVMGGRAESAEANERLQEFRSAQREDFLVWGYLDLASVWDRAEQELAGTSRPEGIPIDSEQLFEELRGTYDRVGFSVTSASDAFALDLTVLHAPGFDPSHRFEPAHPFDSHFAESVPASTMFFFAGFDVYGQSWLPAREYLQDTEFEDGKTLDDLLKEFSDETGLDLEDDVLSLLTGEYAIAADVSNLDSNRPDFSILALLDVADAGRAEETVDELAGYLQDQGAIDIDDSGPIRRWTPAGEADAEAVGVTLRGDAVIAGYPDAAVEEAANGISVPLAETRDWQRTVALLPDETTSIGFLSIARILDELKDTEAEESFDASTGGDLTLADLRAIKSIGIATTSRDNGFGVHFVVFMLE